MTLLESIYAAHEHKCSIVNLKPFTYTMPDPPFNKYGSATTVLPGLISPTYVLIIAEYISKADKEADIWDIEINRKQSNE
jgi:hypothetical protein